ncbi:hypothetical protein RZS08_39370, partial [Arthrospira platensis SPKY1]|nr:hypothetical protein [Arthrospira platensis SPKY1]
MADRRIDVAAAGRRRVAQEVPGVVGDAAALVAVVVFDHPYAKALSAVGLVGPRQGVGRVIRGRVVGQVIDLDVRLDVVEPRRGRRDRRRAAAHADDLGLGLRLADLQRHGRIFQR